MPAHVRRLDDSSAEIDVIHATIPELSPISQRPLPAVGNSAYPAHDVANSATATARLTAPA
jgi:hypothetical protein